VTDQAKRPALDDGVEPHGVEPHGVEPVALFDVVEISHVAAGVVAAFEADWGGTLGAIEIQHVGATALPSGHTKGDVDVNLRVEEARFASVLRDLKARLTVAQPENWTASFASFSTDAYPLPLGVQVTVIGSADDFLVFLRDRMRADEDLARRYDAVKVAAAAHGADAYWHAKDRFLKEVRAP
jgi:GrpB-like predicted nucleotidyltransferase (UPF0157 family)